MSPIQQKFIDEVIEMVERYDKYCEYGGNLNPREFAKSKFCENKLFINEVKEGSFRTFFTICSQKDFLKAVCDDIFLLSGAKEKVHIYMLLYFLTTTNANTILGSFLEYFPQETRDKIVQYFRMTNIKEIIRCKANAVFATREKIKNIEKEFNERSDLLQLLGQMFEERLPKPNKRNKSYTHESGFRLLSYFHSSQNVRSCKMQKQLLNPVSNKDSLKTKNVYNLKKDKKLYSCSLPSIMPNYTRDSESQSRNLDMSTNCVKQTVTQILREQAQVKKKAEQAEKVFKDISKGSKDPYNLSAMLEELRMVEYENELQDIERKHLLGQISQEEARLSRLSVKKKNQAKVAELKMQKLELEQKLAEYKKAEEIRIKEVVEKNHNSELVKQAQTNLLKQKKQVVKEIQNESRQMKILIFQRKQEELNYKINLIRQVKELEQVSRFSFNKEANNKDFGIGNMNSMSLQELRDSLLKLKAEIQENIEQRRKNIKEEKLRQKALIQGAKETIERYKNIPKKRQISIKFQADRKLTPEILKLRQMLKQRKTQASQTNINQFKD